MIYTTISFRKKDSSIRRGLDLETNELLLPNLNVIVQIERNVLRCLSHIPMLLSCERSITLVGLCLSKHWSKSIVVFDCYFYYFFFYQVVDEDIRPPQLLFEMAPKRSGFHWRVESLNASVWSALIRGRKRWGLYPPSQYFIPGLLKKKLSEIQQQKS